MIYELNTLSFYFISTTTTTKFQYLQLRIRSSSHSLDTVRWCCLSVKFVGPKPRDDVSRELQPLDNKVLFQKQQQPNLTTSTCVRSSSHSRFITMVHLRNTLQPIYSPPPKLNKSKLEEEVALLLAENPTVSYLRSTIQGKSRLKRLLLSVFAPRCHLTAESRLFDVRCQRFAPRWLKGR